MLKAIHSDPKHALTHIMYTRTNMHSNLNEINRMLSHTLTDNPMHQVVPTGTTDNSLHSGQDDNSCLDSQ